MARVIAFNKVSSHISGRANAEGNNFCQENKVIRVEAWKCIYSIHLQ